MPHNVYTGDEDGRVVRFSVFPWLFYSSWGVSAKGKGAMGEKEWISRKQGWSGQVEHRAGRDTVAVLLGGGRTRGGRARSLRDESSILELPDMEMLSIEDDLGLP